MRPPQYDADKWFFGANIRRGMRVGMVIATFFTGIAALVRLVVGASAFDRFGLTWIQLVICYFAALLLGGSAYGALIPIKRHVVGAAIMGFILVFPLYTALAIFMGLSLGRIPSVGVGLVIGILLSAFIGGTVGVSIWMDDRNEGRR